MTMFPAAQNLCKQHFYGGRSCISNYTSYSQGVGDDLMSRLEGYDCSSDQACLGSDLVVVGPIIMAAEDESRTDQSVNEAGSSASKDVQEEIKDNEAWLQLSIGGGHMTSRHQDQAVDHDHRTSTELIELSLLPSGNNNNNIISSEEHGRVLAPRFHSSQFQTPRPLTNNNITSTTHHYGTYATSLFNLQHQQGNTSSSFAHDQEINWIYSHRPMTNLSRPIAIASSPSSSTLMAPAEYFSRPFQLHGGINIVAAAGSSIDFRVIDPPPRPHSGIWFMLQASQNQAKEPFLPQIPKSYLRIKDGRITIRLVMKYLVNKLRLESESEVEITCRGQQLQPLLTLQHVRDNLWNLRNAVVSLPPDSTSTPTEDHVMVLHYGRSAS